MWGKMDLVIYNIHIIYVYVCVHVYIYTHISCKKRLKYKNFTDFSLKVIWKNLCVFVSPSAQFIVIWRKVNIFLNTAHLSGFSHINWNPPGLVITDIFRHLLYNSLWAWAHSLLLSIIPLLSPDAKCQASLQLRAFLGSFYTLICIIF